DRDRAMDRRPGRRLGRAPGLVGASDPRTTNPPAPLIDFTAMRHSILICAAGVTLALATTSCSPVIAKAPAPVLAPGSPAAAKAMTAVRLLFGRAIPGGGLVTDGAWAAFLAEEITPRFPEGLTVWRAEGQWADPRGEFVRESVLVLEVLHPAGP